MLVKVSSKGLITLPKQIREEFGIDKGDYLAVSAEDGKIVFRKVKMEAIFTIEKKMAAKVVARLKAGKVDEVKMKLAELFEV